MKNVLSVIGMFILAPLNLIMAQDTIVLQPGPEGKDAYINSHFDYYDQNFGANTNLYAIAGTHNSDPFTCRALMEFDLSGIPENAELWEAKLSLYFANDPTMPYFHYGDNGAFLQRIIEPWDEITVTWNNRPVTTGQSQALLPPSQYETQDYPDIDVTNLFIDILNNPETSYGIMLKLQVEDEYRRLFFASSDFPDPSLRPRLKLILSCANPEVGFTYQVEDQNAIFTGYSPTAQSWLWDFGDGFFSSLQHPEHYYPNEGEYRVCLTVTDSCGTAEICDTINVCSLPVTGFSHNSHELTVQFQDTSKFADQYFWSFGDGFYSNLQNPSYTFDTTGYYNVCLETSNGCGADSVCQMIFVDYSGIENPENYNFSIFPNPSMHEIFIKSSFTGPITVDLLDLSGKQVLEQKFNIIKNETIIISLKEINSGVYIVSLKSDQGQVFNRLVVTK